MDIWERQKQFYTNKFINLKASMQESLSIKEAMEMIGSKDIVADVTERGEKFDKLVSAYMRSAGVIGANVCVWYASAVSVLLDAAGIGHDIYAGACISKKSKTYDKCKGAMEACGEGKHPLVMNHVYVVDKNGVCYENRHEDYSEHLDYVRIV